MPVPPVHRSVAHAVSGWDSAWAATAVSSAIGLAAAIGEPGGVISVKYDVDARA